MNEGSNIPRNLKFLLWKQGIPRDRWVREVSHWCRCDPVRAVEILRGDASLTDAETQSISEATAVEATHLFFDDLIGGTDVFGENLKFLLGSLEHGGQKRLAEYLKVTPGSVYKWGGGSQPPKRRHVAGLLSFFGLNAATDLEKVPLFLSLDPIGSPAKREWLVERIQQIEDERLDQYYPALKKILQ